MNKRTACKHLSNLLTEFRAEDIDENQLDVALCTLLEVLKAEVEQEEATPKGVDLAAAVESLRSEVAEIKAMLAALANPPAYRVDTVTMDAFGINHDTDRKRDTSP